MTQHAVGMAIGFDSCRARFGHVIRRKVEDNLFRHDWLVIESWQDGAAIFLGLPRFFDLDVGKCEARNRGRGCAELRASEGVGNGAINRSERAVLESNRGNNALLRQIHVGIEGARSGGRLDWLDTRLTLAGQECAGRCGSCGSGLRQVLMKVSGILSMQFLLNRGQIDRLD